MTDSKKLMIIGVWLPIIGLTTWIAVLFAGLNTVKQCPVHEERLVEVSFGVTFKPGTSAAQAEIHKEFMLQKAGNYVSPEKMKKATISYEKSPRPFHAPPGSYSSYLYTVKF